MRRAQGDPHLEEGRRHFGSLAEVAYLNALESLGGPERPKVASGGLIPDVLLRSNFYLELFMEDARVNKTPLRLLPSPHRTPPRN